MSLIVKATGTDFKPAPEGLHQAVCVDVVDLGMVESTFKGQTIIKPRVRFYWQIAEKDPENGKRFLITQRFTASLHEKATLRKTLEAWRGRKFTEQELKGFNLETVLGANCQLQIIHNTKDQTTYANIAAIVPLGKGTPKLEPEGYVRVKDRTPESATPAETDDREEAPF